MTAPSTRPASRGFTLLELILTLTLIAITAGVSISAYFGRSEVTLENACVLMARELRSAQNRAAYLQQPVLFAVDIEGERYEVERGGRGASDVYVRDFDDSAVFEGIDIVETNFEDDVILYDKSGFLVHGGEIVVAFETDVRVVRLEAPTGRIEILNTSSDWHDTGF